MLDESILHADTICDVFYLANYFIKDSAASWFPYATLVFSQLPACLDEAILHGDELYIS